MKIVTVRVEVETRHFLEASGASMDGNPDEEGYTYTQLSSVQNLYDANQQLWPPVYEAELHHRGDPVEMYQSGHPLEHHGPNGQHHSGLNSMGEFAEGDDQMSESNGEPKVRQAANVRERKRMCSINKAFEVSNFTPLQK